ncbi:sulfatase [Candidatus Poribacteria bacterium]|nr:sulfatase [Candidatus Poribacteria bacterium]
MASKRPNLLVFAVDSLRADHMSCYGYKHYTTPHADTLARDGVLFENCFSAYIPTTPAYTSMLTGLDVFSSDVVSLRHENPLFPEIRTLPQMLREHGYVSACIGHGEGLWKGFDTYENYQAWMSWEDRPGLKAHNLNEVAIPRLNALAASDKPWLLYLRHMDPHAPYLPPSPFDRMFYDGDEFDPANESMEPVWAFKPFAEFLKSWMPPGLTDKDYVIAQYDGEVAYMDACIRRILTRLDELGLTDDTIIIYNSDHGETLYDHDIYFDHHGLYDVTLHVPLIVKGPGVPVGKRVSGYTLHEDFVPTVLDLLDIESDIAFDGKSVLPLIRGERATNYSEFYITECTWMRKHGWRTPEWKYFESLEPDFHHKPPFELYNLIDDPDENHNLAATEPQVVELLQNRMNAWIAKRTAETGRPNPILRYNLGMNLSIGSIATAKKLQEK